jgi:hypothetical protein
MRHDLLALFARERIGSGTGRGVQRGAGDHTEPAVRSRMHRAGSG